MKTASQLRTAAAAATLGFATLGRAMEATGTEAVGQMQISGSTFALMIGAIVGLGVVVWLVSKFVSR
ncbi:hypothetical protein [Anaeromyxobacter terrae]|uniref:hypothetical protein n=1 Tax=Anaeromyxobacter terrae TaxID=2925406 RepID=UPI001F59C071|nr:hypothetical protein [Anaeromyxobacter sp. SG22]